MTWLTGKPKRTIALRWPSNDPTSVLEALERKYIPMASFPYSLLDDQILRAAVNTNADPPTSYIYLAQLYLAIANNDDQVTFNICSVLPYVVHQVALLPNRVGYASLMYNNENSTITLRIHTWDGSILKETSTHAQAAYGRLVVQEDLIGVSISSGEESDPELGLDGFPPATSRVDFDYSARNRAQFDAPFGDEIVVWNWKNGSVNHVKIPQDEMAPLRHEGKFEFVDQAFIALGGKVSSSGTPSALLKTFSLSSDFTRTFTHGENFEMDEDLDVVAMSSSATPDDILVNHHHSASRITVIKRYLLKDTLDIHPDSSDPGNLHMMFSHRSYIRTIAGGVNAYLPAVCDNRILLSFDISDGNLGLDDFAIGQNRRRSVFYICDFDQQRCDALINTSLEERGKLEEQIKSNNEVAQVTIIQRNYYTTIEDDADMEYPYFQSPPEWKQHLIDLWKTQEARREGKSDPPTLEFDEGPIETKNTPRLAFTRSVFCLPLEVNGKTLKLDQFALSPCGIIYVPGFNEHGHVFVFEE